MRTLEFIAGAFVGVSALQDVVLYFMEGEVCTRNTIYGLILGAGTLAVDKIVKKYYPSKRLDN